MEKGEVNFGGAGGSGRFCDLAKLMRGEVSYHHSTFSQEVLDSPPILGSFA